MAPVAVILHSMGVRMRRYLDDWLIQAVRSSVPGGKGQGPPTVFGVGDKDKLREVSPDAISGCGILRGEDRCPDFEGFTHDEEDRFSSLSCRRVRLLKKAACFALAVSSGPSGLYDTINSSGPSQNEGPSVVLEKPMGLCGPRVHGGMEPSV